MSSLRLRHVSITLFVCLFSLLAESAYATHFRYGYISWERDLTYSGAPNIVKVDVTIEGGGRWSYPWTSAVLPFATPSCTGGAAACCVGGITTGATGAGSCPPLGGAVNWSGSFTGTVGFYSPVTGQTLTITRKHGVALTTPINYTSTTLFAPNPLSPLATTPLDVIVTQISKPEDTFYGRFTFSILMDRTKPLHISWSNAARLSTLLDSNGDQNWRLVSVIDFTGANAGLTKSPKSQISAVMQVANQQDNIVTLPAVTFDNLAARWRIATTQESSLVNPVPLSPSLFSLNATTGQVSFRPRTVGLYAVQFRLIGFDPSTQQERVNIPIDVMFNSVAQGVYTNTLATTNGQTELTATVGQPISYTVRSTLSPPNSAYTMNINNTALPAGAAVTGGVCSGQTGFCDKVFTWTPTVTSTASVVCYTGSVVNASTLVASAPQMCVTVNLNPLPTTLAVDTPAEAAAGGGPLTLRARLTRNIDNAPLPGRTITFTYDANPGNPPWVGNATATTDAAGWATATLTTAGAVDPASSFTARFTAISGELEASSASSSVISIKRATTSLSAPVAAAAPLPSVGYPLSVSTVLNRHWTDGGLFGVGAMIDFTISQFGAPITVTGGPTNTAGVATADLPGPTALGSHVVTAYFAGNDALYGNVFSPAAQIFVRQRTKVTASAGIASQNVPSPVTAVLVTLPDATTPVAGRQVTFSSPGSTSVTAVTDATGVATAMMTFSTIGMKVVTASYTPDPATELNRNGLALVDSSTANIDVSPAVATTTTITSGTTAFSGQPMTMSVHVQTSGGAAVPAGGTVRFTVGANPILAVVTATTDSNGDATAIFTPNSAGTLVFAANYEGVAGYAPSTASRLVTVTKAVTALASLTVNTLDFVGNTLTASTNLQRLSAPAGPVANAPVTLTITGGASNPGGPTTTTQTVTSDANGNVQALFPLDARGQFTIDASYAGSTALNAAATSATTTVYQRITLLLNAAHGFATDPVNAQAAVFAVPQNSPVTFANIDFDFNGVVTNGAALTDAGGVATLSRVFPWAGVYTMTARFNDAAGFYADAAGNQVASASSATATIASVATAVSVQAPATGIVGQVLNVASVLARISPPAGALTGRTISIAITGPNGTTNLQGATDASGQFGTAFTPLERGSYTIVASFPGDAALMATSGTTTVTVAHPTSLAIAPVTGAAGKPVAVKAVLSAIPGNWGVAGQTVTFTFTGAGAPSAVSAMTNGDGEAVVTATFMQPGTVAMTASFSNAAAFYGDSSASSTATVTNTAPTFSAPANISAAATGPSGAAVNFAVANGNDAEDGALIPVCSASSGDTFPLGATTVTCTVTDLVGSTASDSFTITVFNTAPTIADVLDISLPATSAAGRVVTFTTTADDAEEGALAPVCTSSSGDTFPIGTTTVSCTVTDRVGVSASTSFSVTITNNAPTIIDLPDLNGEATGAAGRAFSFTSTANDTEEGALAPVCSAAPGTFPIGATTVTCTVTDVTGASATDSFVITVVDTTAPVLTLPTIAPAFAASGSGNVVTYVATALDIVDGATAVTCSPVSGSTFPIATTTVNCSTADSRGNSSNGSFDVTITNTAPTIADLDDLSGEATGANGRAFTFASTGNDAEEGALTPVCSAASGTFPIGTTTVTCTVTDVAGLSASDSFTITVVDTTAPALTLPTIAPAFATSAAGSEVVYTATALDIVDGATAVTCSPVSGSTFPIATTTVNCSTSDSRGNSSNGSFTVSITNTPPTIADLADLSGEATSAAGRAFTFVSSGNDAEDGGLTPVCSAASGTFPIGTTTVTCTVTDVAGYTASDSFTITVRDTTAPAVTVNSITVEQTSPAGATGNYTFSATDIVDGTMTPTCTPAAGTTFARGITAVSCTVTDANGNAGTASGTVTVVDTIKPVVTYTGNAGTYTADQVINITCAATDSGSGVASTTCANITGPAHTFAVGVNTRSASATDAAGNTNSATVSFTVTVPPSSVGNVITQFFDSPTEAAKANQTLGQATSAPNASSRAAHLNKLIKDIEKEIGKTITAAEAATLIALIQNLY